MIIIIIIAVKILIIIMMTLLMMVLLMMILLMMMMIQNKEKSGNITWKCTQLKTFVIQPWSQNNDQSAWRKKTLRLPRVSLIKEDKLLLWSHGRPRPCATEQLRHRRISVIEGHSVWGCRKSGICKGHFDPLMFISLVAERVLNPTGSRGLWWIELVGFKQLHSTRSRILLGGIRQPFFPTRQASS